MNIHLLGTRGEVEATSKSHSKNSGVLIDNILFDVGESSHLDKNPKAIFITHLHPDHWEIDKDIKVPVYMHFKTAKNLKEKDRKRLMNLKIFSKEEPIEVEDLVITPYRVTHSVKYYTVAYKVKRKNTKESLFYSPDILWLRDYTEKLKDVKTWLVDGSSLEKKGIVRRQKETKEPIGHLGIPTAVRIADKIGIKTLIVLHLGEEAIKMGDKELKAKIEEIKGNRDLNILLGKDSMTLNTAQLEVGIEPITPKRIVETPRAGLYLTPPHAALIASGEKTAVVKTKKLEQYIKEPVYLIQDKLCFGIIALQEPVPINQTQFKKLANKHRISQKEADKWSFSQKKELYYYEVTPHEIWAKPRPVKIPTGPQIWIRSPNIKFVKLNELTDAEIYIMHTEFHSHPDLSIYDFHQNVKLELESRHLPHRELDWMDRPYEELLHGLIREAKE